MNIHQNHLQLDFKKAAEENYLDFVIELQEEIDFDHPFLDEYFSKVLSQEIKNDLSLSQYSEKKFFWLSQLESLIFLLDLCEEYQDTDSIEDQEELEEEIFYFWDASEHSQLFMDYLGQGKSVWECTQEMIPVLENQILSFYYLHIALEFKPSDNKHLIYTIVPELGESTLRLYLGDKQNLVSYNGKNIKTFPGLIINSLDVENQSISIANESYTMAPYNAFQFKDLNLYLLPNCKEGIKREEEFKQNIIKALTIIEKHSPKCFQAFKNFTKVIVPVNEKNIVSYSMQSLPGYSCINMFDRDFVDLIDDLIHENGHHYLNCILNSEELIIEDDDKIYYSPWRRALRPIRGIYHAVFTFYWALELFSNLFKAKEELSLSKEEIGKVANRVVEEYTMLIFCESFLEHAFAGSKVTEAGDELIQGVFHSITEHAQIFEDAQSYLESEHPMLMQQFVEMSSELKDKKQHYTIN